MSRSFRRSTISFAETPRKFLNSTVRTTGGLTDTLRSSAWAFSSAPVPATTDKNHPTLILDLLPAGGRPIATLVFVANNELADAAHAASAAGCAAGLQPLIGLLLFLRGYDGLTCVAAFPDSGARHEFSGAAAALFRHGLL